MNFLSHQTLTTEVAEVVSNLQKSFGRFHVYTSYFDKTISRNVQRELETISMKKMISDFWDTIKEDTRSRNISLEKDIVGSDLYTRQMHPSEWGAILFNLYSNSKKAIIRAERPGRILIKTYGQENLIYLEFLDNGDGISKENEIKIFNAFFTTSDPNNSPLNGEVTGTGLGLKIIKDIIESYGGKIKLTQPIEGYSTSFQIQIPKATQNEINEFESKLFISG